MKRIIPEKLKIISFERLGRGDEEWLEEDKPKRIPDERKSEINNVPTSGIVIPGINTFKSIKEAADWLIANGYTNGKNPSSTITSVCKKKSGRNSYLGFGWRYTNA